ncbi:MAG: ATP-binding protein [Nitrospinaceae bacterium]
MVPLKPVTIHVRTINDDPKDFDALFSFWNQLNDDFLDVTFDFTHCNFLRQNAVAFLGGLARLVQYRSGKVNFLWNTLEDAILTNLAQNGFGEAFGLDVSSWTGNSIPYRQDILFEQKGLTDYLKWNWLGRGWVHMSENLRDAITCKVLECYLNAFEHSGSSIGVFSCGQHYPQLKALKIAIVDFGIGIPANVRSFKNNPLIGTEQALEWAFQSGTTTKPNGLGRGLGLDLLKQFVRVNKGRMEIFSHDGYAVFEENREEYSRRSSFFEGTLIHITLKCDEKYYSLASETMPEYYF